MTTTAATTGRRSRRRANLVLALCGATILAYGAFVFAYSGIALATTRRENCPPPPPTTTTTTTNDAPPARVVVAREKTSMMEEEDPKLRDDDQQGGDHRRRFSYGIVPDHCVSPVRGMEFDKIYANGKWFEGKGLRHPKEFYGDADWPPKDVQRRSASGAGSDRGGNSVNSLKILKRAIAAYGVRSVIDVPCGDVNWIFDSWETDSLPLYVGLDVSFAVVGINSERFGHHANKEFRIWDATACPLPKFRNERGETTAVDLVHVRDVIQHLTLEQGVRYFCNVFESGAGVLVTTTFEGGANRNVREGGFYENDLAAEPFSFPPGEDCVATHPDHEKDLTCVYNLTQGWVQEFVSSKC